MAALRAPCRTEAIGSPALMFLLVGFTLILRSCLHLWAAGDVVFAGIKQAQDNGIAVPGGSRAYRSPQTCCSNGGGEPHGPTVGQWLASSINAEKGAELLRTLAVSYRSFMFFFRCSPLRTAAADAGSHARDAGCIAGDPGEDWPADDRGNPRTVNGTS